MMLITRTRWFLLLCCSCFIFIAPWSAQKVSIPAVEANEQQQQHFLQEQQDPPQLLLQENEETQQQKDDSPRIKVMKEEIIRLKALIVQNEKDIQPRMVQAVFDGGKKKEQVSLSFVREVSCNTSALTPPCTQGTEREPGSWAFTTLVMGGKDSMTSAKHIVVRDQSISKYLDKLNHSSLNITFTFVYFHEGNLQPGAVKLIEQKLQGHRTEFIDVSKGAFRFKDGEQTKKYAKNKIGYYNMCAFWSIDVWQFLCKYEYMMRLDDDCQLKEIKGNIFQQFADRGLEMGYAAVRSDRHLVTAATLVPWAVRYEHLCLGGGAAYGRLAVGDPAPVCVVYSNFGMTRLAFWSRPDVYSYVWQMQPYILRFRWGDAPIWFAAAVTFAGHGGLGMLRGMSYNHGSHGTLVDTAVGRMVSGQGKVVETNLNEECRALFRLKP